MNFFTDVIKNKYADFTGRARRQEYWMFYLWTMIFSICLSVLVGLFGDSGAAFIFSALAGLFSLAILIPSLAIAVRRLHDIGKDWPFLFVLLIPFVGVIWYIVLMATDSQPGDNQFGPCPK